MQDHVIVGGLILSQTVRHLTTEMAPQPDKKTGRIPTEVEAFAAEAGGTRADWSAADLASDATRLLRGDATQFFRPDDVRSGGSRNRTRSRR